MKLPILSISDAVERDLCCGCGVCVAAEPDAIRMVDDIDLGRRPVVADDATLDASVHAICPGLYLDPASTDVASDLGADLDLDPDASAMWGPVLEVWEGYASDEEIRFRGSSGGVVTALAAFALDHGVADGVCHVRARRDAPYLNESVISHTRDDLLESAGARYAPASPGERLIDVKRSGRPHVFIGKPCDVAGATSLGARDPEIGNNLALNIAIFCAGTPTLRGTFEMLDAMGVEDPDRLGALRYRGHGWPGDATAQVAEPGGRTRENALPYDTAWGDILRRHKQWRCHVCPDHTGEHADLSVGDPWYREIKPGEGGRSLIIVRTERGRAFLRRAVDAGAVSIQQVNPELILASQPSLLRAQSAVWGRLLGMRLLGLKRPRFGRMRRMLGHWMRHLTWSQRARSVFGVIRHVRTRRLYERKTITPFTLREPEIHREESCPIQRVEPRARRAA